MWHVHRLKQEEVPPGLHSSRQALVLGPLSAPAHVGVTKPALQYEKMTDTHMVGACRCVPDVRVKKRVNATQTTVELCPFYFYHLFIQP